MKHKNETRLSLPSCTTKTSLYLITALHRNVVSMQEFMLLYKTANKKNIYI